MYEIILKQQLAQWKISVTLDAQENTSSTVVYSVILLLIFYQYDWKRAFLFLAAPSFSLALEIYSLQRLYLFEVTAIEDTS